MLRFGGLDLSLTSLGAARLDDGGIAATQLRTNRKGHARLNWLIGGAADYVTGCDLVAIEGPSYNSRTQYQHETAGLWWLVAHELHRRAVPYISIPPATLKKFATGSGLAPKPDVLLAAAKRFPAVEFTSEDAADALWLLAMVCERYGCPLAEMPKDRVALLYATVSKKGKRYGLPVIDWPYLQGRIA
jgi:Holliday junction resolvasome RuvABC endonuclease subunit